MNEFFKAILRAFFPRRCIYCDRVIPPEARACKECEPFVPRMALPICYRCGRTRSLCNCKGHRRQFERCVAAMRYEGGAMKAVKALKRNDDSDLVETIAQELAIALRERVDAAAFDVITFVPMNRKERRRRGYNQSELLAKELSSLLGIPCRSLLVKSYETLEQKTLSASERQGNMLGAFDASEDVTDLRILIVDDVITTGSTLNECAKMLKIRGALSVTAAAFAATIPKEQNTDDV